MSRNFIVYESRNRMTGTLCQTLDSKHNDAPKEARNGLRYIALCVEHKTAVRFAEHYPAGRAIAHVDEWCKGCQKMIAKGETVRGANMAPKAPVFTADDAASLAAAMGQVKAPRKARAKPAAIVTEVATEVAS